MLTHAELLRVLHYDPETGIFTWRVALSNRVKVGDEAGSIVRRDHQLYRVIGIHGRSYLAHRLAQFYMTGEWPENEMDHEDRDGLDNRWLNLRPATHAENARNSKAKRDGLKGVYLHKASGLWHARITADGSTESLGYFQSEGAAHEAYKAASKRVHGQFGRFQ